MRKREGRAGEKEKGKKGSKKKKRKHPGIEIILKDIRIELEAWSSFRFLCPRTRNGTETHEWYRKQEQFVKRMYTSGLADILVSKVLWYNKKDLSSIFRSHMKRQITVERAYNPSGREVGTCRSQGLA